MNYTVRYQNTLLKREGLRGFIHKYFNMLSQEKQKEALKIKEVNWYFDHSHVVFDIMYQKAVLNHISSVHDLKTQRSIKEDITYLDNLFKKERDSTMSKTKAKTLTTEQAKQRYPKADWRTEVSNDDTQLGYDEWMLHKVESDGYTICEDPQRLYARQIATILFALRYLQRNLDSSGYELSDHIRVQHLEPLTMKEIDQLCQDINLNKITL